MARANQLPRAEAIKLVLKVKVGIKPVPDLHTVRHTALTPEQNLALKSY